MSQHDYLRERWAQHAVKNNLSKYDDAKAKDAAQEVLKFLKELYPDHNFELKSKLSFKQIKEYCQRDFNIGDEYNTRNLQPDGGVIWMDEKYPILISEMKRQGTNDERAKEGKEKQATGNAIERLGKNLIGFKCLYENDDILPFICFCWGCDFKEPTVLAKLYTLNSFYPIDTFYTEPNTYTNKPFTCILKPDSAFTLEELVLSMSQIAVHSIQYYLNKEEK